MGLGSIGFALADAGAGVPSPLELALDWHVHPLVSAAIVLNAAAYSAGAVRASRNAGRWPRRRTAAFLAGLVVLAVSLQSGLDSYGTELLSVHMAQHVLLTLVAPPLLLLGAPVTLALRTLSGRSRRLLAATVTSRAARAVVHPVIAWPAFTAVLVGSHLTPFYDAAVRSEALHGLEHFLYLAGAVLFWAPLVGSDPLPRSEQPALRILYLLLAMPPMALVGAVLAYADSVRYPAYLEPARTLGASALEDQVAGGMIMWLGGSAILVAATLAVGWAALAREERRQAARDAYADRRRGPRGHAGGSRATRATG